MALVLTAIMTSKISLMTIPTVSNLLSLLQEVLYQKELDTYKRTFLVKSKDAVAVFFNMLKRITITSLAKVVK